MECSDYKLSLCCFWSRLVSRYLSNQYLIFFSFFYLAYFGVNTSHFPSNRPCIIVTYVIIVLPAILIYYYLAPYGAEKIIFDILFAVCIFGLTAVITADPGLVRKYHHARSRHWTYCDLCYSFRPPGTVHCSTCQVCIAGYDHHCPVSYVIMKLRYLI
jgi:DHHC palmitoyltransferase